MEYEIHTKQQAINLFTNWINGIQKKDVFEPRLVTVEEFKDSVSLNQQRYIFGYCYPNMLACEIENGNELFVGMKPTQKQAVDLYHSYMKMLYFYTVLPEGSPFDRLPKSLAFGKSHKEDVSTFIEKLHFHAANIGMFLVAPDRQHLGLN